MIKRIASIRFFYGLLSLLFVYINYSESSWIFFNNIGGMVWAKIGPEITGILFFSFLSFVYIKTFYKNFKIKIEKKEWFTFLFLLVVILVYRHKQFLTYFYHDDFYLTFNRFGTAYSIYLWEPWLSSFPLWEWEFVRALAGYSILPYQIASLTSHLFLSIGVYYLSKFLSKNYCVALLSSFLVLTTTISFEAFQWFIHPINFAWQGIFISFSLIALNWEIRKNKGKTVPYLSAFFMMAAFGAGIARIGFILPLISGVDLLVSAKYFELKRIGKWVFDFMSRQWIFYSLVLTFLLIRNLLMMTGIKTEVVAIPLFKIYLYVIGIFTFPVELYIEASELVRFIVKPGTLTVWSGLLFLIASGLYVLVTKIRRKRIPLILSVGFLWLLFSALYYTLFGPHLPANELEISIAARSHHLSYLASIGPLMIWGYLSYQVLVFLKRFKKPFGRILPIFMIFGVAILNYILLSDQYDNYLQLPEGVRVMRQQFFFDTIRKYISSDAEKVNIFYDESYLKRKDNFKPNDGYYWAFWDIKKVKILWGFEELENYLAGIKDLKRKNYEIDNLYYMYTDYDNGLIEDNLSETLRENVRKQTLQVLPNGMWRTIWGSTNGNIYLPEIVKNDEQQISYFKNSALVISDLEFPAVFTPRLKLRLDVRDVFGTGQFADLRAGILSQIFADWNLPEAKYLSSLVEYYSNKKSQTDIDFDNILNTPNVKDNMVCGKKEVSGGITFLISWVGEPDSNYSKFTLDDRKDIFSRSYTQRFYSLCYFPNTQGVKNIDVELPYTGSVLRGIVIIPLTKSPVSLRILDSSLETPRILNK